MNEELQSKIADALNKLTNGAPEAWQVLVVEMQMRSMALACFCGVLFLFGLGVIFKHYPKIDWKDGNRSALFTVLAAILVLFSLMAGSNEAADALSPSIELIKLLR